MSQSLTTRSTNYEPGGRSFGSVTTSQVGNRINYWIRIRFRTVSEIQSGPPQPI